MRMIIACIPKGLRYITTGALVKSRELVAFYIVCAVKKFDVANG